MLKWTSTLTLALTVGLLALLLAYGLPQGWRGSAEAAVVSPAAAVLQDEAAQTIAAYQAREAQMQPQLSRLTETLQQRQAAYEQQLAELAARQAALVTGLEQTENQATALAEQIATLQVARNERLGVYQTQLDQAQVEYDARYATMALQLAEAEAKLAEANAVLGR